MGVRGSSTVVPVAPEIPIVAICPWYTPHAVVIAVGDVDSALRIGRQPGRVGDLRQHRRSVISRIARSSIPRERGQRAADRNLINPLAIEIRDVEIPCAIQSDIARCCQFGAGGRAAVAIASRRNRTAAGDSLNRAARCRYFSDARIAQVRNIQVPCRVDRQPVGSIQLRLIGRSAIAAEPGYSRACHGLDQAIGRDLANAMIHCIRYIEVSFGIERNAFQLPEQCRYCRPAVSDEAAASDGLNRVASRPTGHAPCHWKQREPGG